MAGVAKWLRLRFVVSAFAGSTPVICPIFVLQRLQLHKRVGAFCICRLGVYTPNLALFGDLGRATLSSGDTLAFFFATLFVFEHVSISYSLSGAISLFDIA